MQCFRLRVDQQIVGYMRYITPSQQYFSTDRFWWKAQPIDYTIKDSYVEKDDVNQQWVFEHDIIEVSSFQVPDPLFKAVLLSSKHSFEFIALNYETFEEIPACDWQHYRFKVISYLFINQDLEFKLKQKGYLND